MASGSGLQFLVKFFPKFVSYLSVGGADLVLCYCWLVGFLWIFFFLLFFVYRIFLEQALCSEAESNGTGFQSRCLEFSRLHIYHNRGDL